MKTSGTINEAWKAIEGYDDSHEISDKGRVRSVDRLDNQGRWLDGRILTSFFNKKTGYFQTGIKKDGKQSQHRNHRLVAEAFIPNPENKSQVNHIDGNKLNNFVENLEWSTPYENTNHAIEAGLKPSMKGVKGLTTKLTEVQVIEIFKRSKSGANQFLLADEFGVNQRTISAIKCGVTWGWLTSKL